jgi:N-acetylneuraminic acid mutarotase
MTALALAACGGSKSSNTGSYTVGGTITGLTAGSVVLIYNDTSTVTVPSTATTWVFPVSFAANTSYAVNVLTQPVGELCEVTSDASATALTANVTGVAVVCGPYTQWTWESGSNGQNASGIYGTQGAAAAINVPGGRYAASSWIDAAGNLWLFGGYGYDSTGNVGRLNDLWQFSPTTGQWTWVGGGNADNGSGIYGTQGTAAAGNVPGARYSSSAWTDPSGNLWLFGGFGYDATGAVGSLNDLWRYTPSSGTWTWVGGGNGDNAAGIYATLGAASAANLPGARQAANSWVDASGNLWLYGGYGYDSSGTAGYLNDLWQYTPSTGLWTWVNGGSGDNASGVYGTQGTAAATNVPGARQAASSWTDSSGNLWLFGGYGYDSISALGDLNDMWEYSPSSGQWTWVSGTSGDNAAGVYGTQGAVSISTAPGARQAASAWIDSSGHLWLYGGTGYGASGNGYLGDLWRFTPTP